MEYRVALRAVMGADFREGVRALLLDKDGAPRWHPAALAGVKEADIAGYFASLGARELQLPREYGRIISSFVCHEPMALSQEPVLPRQFGAFYTLLMSPPLVCTANITGGLRKKRRVV